MFTSVLSLNTSISLSLENCASSSSSGRDNPFSDLDPVLLRRCLSVKNKINKIDQDVPTLDYN